MRVEAIKEGQPNCTRQLTEHKKFHQVNMKWYFTVARTTPEVILQGQFPIVRKYPALAIVITSFGSVFLALEVCKAVDGNIISAGRFLRKLASAAPYKTELQTFLCDV